MGMDFQKIKRISAEAAQITLVLFLFAVAVCGPIIIFRDSPILAFPALIVGIFVALAGLLYWGEDK